MAQGRKTTQELIAEEQKRAEQVRARMSELKTRQRVEDRKRDSHRKIVVGAAAMAHIRIDPQFRKALRDALNTAVTEPKHRAVIPDLLDEQAFQEAMRDAAKKAAVEAEDAKVAGGAGDAKQAEAAAKEPMQPARPPQPSRTGTDIQKQRPA
jgi:hypothetical protein